MTAPRTPAPSRARGGACGGPYRLIGYRPMEDHLTPSRLTLDDALERDLLTRIDAGGIRQRTLELHYLLTAHRGAPSRTQGLSLDAVVRLVMALEGLGYVEAADAPAQIAVRLTRTGRLRLDALQPAEAAAAA